MGAREVGQRVVADFLERAREGQEEAGKMSSEDDFHGSWRRELTRWMINDFVKSQSFKTRSLLSSSPLSFRRGGHQVVPAAPPIPPPSQHGSYQVFPTAPPLERYLHPKDPATDEGSASSLEWSH